MQRVLITITLALLLTGCGRKGPLIAPEALLPAPVNDLQAVQKGEDFQVSWSIPTQQEGGRALKALVGFRLFKREVLPPEEDCESCPNAYRLQKNVDLAYLQDVLRLGNRLFFRDTDLIVGKTYQYKVVSFQADDTTSRDSNKARLKKMAPPAPPRLTALFTSSGVRLTWEKGATSSNVNILGYNIYRRQGDAPPAIIPLNDTPLPGTDYEDLRLERGVTYAYILRTVSLAEGVRVESEPSNEVKGTLAEPE